METKKYTFLLILIYATKFFAMEMTSSTETDALSDFDYSALSMQLVDMPEWPEQLNENSNSELFCEEKSGVVLETMSCTDERGSTDREAADRNENSGKFKCDRSRCKKEYGNQRELLDHVLINHFNVRIKCVHADCLARKPEFFFRWGQTWAKHNKEQHDNSGKCRRVILIPLNGETYKFRLGREKHKKIVDPLKKSFLCSWGACGKEYGSKGALKNHVKVEHEGVRWQCSGCARIFKSKQNWGTHNQFQHNSLSDCYKIESSNQNNNDDKQINIDDAINIMNTEHERFLQDTLQLVRSVGDVTN